MTDPVRSMTAELAANLVEKAKDIELLMTGDADLPPAAVAQALVWLAKAKDQAEKHLERLGG